MLQHKNDKHDEGFMRRFSMSSCWRSGDIDKANNSVTEYAMVYFVVEIDT